MSTSVALLHDVLGVLWYCTGIAVRIIDETKSEKVGSQSGMAYPKPGHCCFHSPTLAVGPWPGSKCTSYTAYMRLKFINVIPLLTSSLTGGLYLQLHFCRIKGSIGQGCEVVCSFCEFISSLISHQPYMAGDPLDCEVNFTIFQDVCQVQYLICGEGAGSSTMAF